MSNHILSAFTKKFASLALRGFATRYDYDASYLEELAHSSPGAFFGYLAATPLSSYRKSLPVEVYLAAKLVSTKAHDCGSCLRLVINMAREANMEDDLILAILTNHEDILPQEILLGVRYTNAIIGRSTLDLIHLEKDIIAHWGKPALTDISLAVAFGGFYPMLKRGLGHANSCEPVLSELKKLRIASVSD